MQGIVDCFRHTIFSFAESGTHDCYSTIFQDGFHIGKVKIDCTPHGNNLGNALGSNGKSIIGFAEGVHKSKVGVYFAQAFVVDNQQGINMLGDTLYAVQCLDNFLFSFEDKGDGDDADSQNIHFLRNAGDDRGGSGSGSSSHSGGDKYHFGTVVQQRFDFFATLFGGFSGTFGTVSGTQSLGNRTPQLQFYGDGRLFQRLVVRVTQNERYVVYAFPVHVVYSVTTTTTYTNHFDDLR